MSELEQQPTMLKDMVDAVLQQAGESDEAKLAEAEAAAETASQQPGETQDNATTKVSSADALAFADALDAEGEGLTKASSVAAPQLDPRDALLQKLGADIAPQHEPQAETNLATVIKPKEPKQDKATTVPTAAAAPPMETPNKLGTNAEQDTPGKTKDNLLKAAAERTQKLAALKLSVMRKLAGEDVSPANISAPKTAVNPEDEVAPAPPQQGDRAMIGSSAAAISYTKGDAKATPKKALRDVLKERALSKATDSKLHENLVNAGRAGVKISSVQRNAVLLTLQKVASRVGTPEHTWLADKVHQIREKRASVAGNRESVRRALEARAFFSPATN